MMPAVRSTILLVAMSLAACKTEVAPPVVKPIDAAATAAFAEELKGALTPCDAGRVDALIDYDTMGRIAIAGLPQGQAVLRGFLDKARSVGFGKGLCGTDQRVVAHRYLGLWSKGGESWPLFRVLVEGNVNYQAYRPGRDKDGKVHIVDYYSFMTGELTSETMRGMFDAMSGKLKQAEDALPVTERLRTAMLKGDHAAARTAIEQLPPSLRQTKAIMIHDIMISQKESDSAYQRAIESYAARFPGDPSLDLVSLDGLYLRKDYTGALAAVDKIDKAVGGDPYLDSLRASLHAENGDLDKAVHHARQAVTREAELETLWTTLLGIHVLRKDAAQTLATMDEMVTRFGSQIDEEVVAREPQWEFLRTSPEWKKRQAAAD
jgi:hypothetical protein